MTLDVGHIFLLLSSGVMTGIFIVLWWSIRSLLADAVKREDKQDDHIAVLHETTNNHGRELAVLRVSSDAHERRLGEHQAELAGYARRR